MGRSKVALVESVTSGLLFMCHLVQPGLLWFVQTVELLTAASESHHSEPSQIPLQS